MKLTLITAAANSLIDFDKLAALFRYDPAQPMLFNTGLFMILFLVFLLIYRLCRNWRVGRMVFTIAFSLFFYYKNSGAACLLLLGVCISDYLLGLWMGNAKSRAQKRWIVFLNVFINLGMLTYFKYFQLILDTISRFMEVGYSFEALLLPAGISFFTFRSISYIVDLYRGQMEPCRNLLDYIFFLTFFPPLLAGPVVRAKDMLPQVAQGGEVSRENTSLGIFLIICGLIKKVVIADYISGNFVDRVFDNPALYSGFENLLAQFGFTVQLYCDFSGYSDMAIGLALLLGFTFRENFNAPFKSQNVTEFWRRWHISLSTWLRDYLYIPMGGNRCSRPRMYFNQFMTMVLGGLWHGASWMYVIWGATHGVYLVVHKMFRSIVPARAVQSMQTSDGEVVMEEGGGGLRGFLDSKWARPLNITFTFLLVMVTMTIFRAPSLDTVGTMFHRILFEFHPEVILQFVSGYMTICLLLAFAFIFHFTPSRYIARMKEQFCNTPFVLQALMLAIILFVVIQVRQSEIVPFIYLQY